MPRQRDRSALVKDKLVRLADHDLTDVLRARLAVKKMVRLGYTPAMLLARLEADPPGEGTVLDDQPFLGFENRAEATLAAVSAMSDNQRPGMHRATEKRIEALIKNQEPERGATTIGLAVVSVPAMMAPESIGEVRRFKRLQSGGLRAIAAAGEVVEMEEEQEAVFSIKKAPAEG